MREQDETLAGIDSAVMAGMVSAGLFYFATYRSEFGADQIPCKVILDRNVAIQSLDSGATSRVNFITTFDPAVVVTKPPNGARFTITKTGETFRVDSVDQWDGSTCAMTVALDTSKG